jgi:hypothetical protein
LTGKLSGGVTIHHAQLAPRPIAVGVHRGLGHAQGPGDLFRRQVLVHEAQAFALALREQPHGVIRLVVLCAHGARSKRRLGVHVYFNEKG